MDPQIRTEWSVRSKAIQEDRTQVVKGCRNVAPYGLIPQSLCLKGSTPLTAPPASSVSCTVSGPVLPASESSPSTVSRPPCSASRTSLERNRMSQLLLTLSRAELDHHGTRTRAYTP